MFHRGVSEHGIVFQAVTPRVLIPCTCLACALGGASFSNKGFLPNLISCQWQVSDIVNIKAFFMQGGSLYPHTGAQESFL